MAALAAREISESFARTICVWTDKLPEESRQSGDETLLGAAGTGASLAELSGFAADLYEQSLPSTPDDGEDFDDRSVKVATTFEGAGVIHGNLTPKCAALVTTVLDSLSAPRGAEDTRSHDQRFHDALEDALDRLVAAGLLPERAGQPTKAMVHVSLGEMRLMDTGSALQQEWITRMRGRWAVARARASVTGSDGSAWLDGDAARAATCDAMMVPVVTGDVDTTVLDDLVRLCVELSGHGQCPGRSGHQDRDQGQEQSSGQDMSRGQSQGQVQDRGQDLGNGQCQSQNRGQARHADAGTGPGCGHGPCCCQARPPLTPRAREALEQAIIGKAVDLLSGPGGLASFLRTRLLAPRLAGPSLPLDVGVSRDIPAAIRQAVILRANGHCEWAGHCDQPAAACEVHHLTHRANGGKTSVKDCGLYCFYHHQVVIHRQGWTVTLNPDGTTTARSPDGTKVFHSHGPPTTRAG
jgi:hypothetical protein